MQHEFRSIAVIGLIFRIKIMLYPESMEFSPDTSDVGEYNFSDKNLRDALRILP